MGSRRQEAEAALARDVARHPIAYYKPRRAALPFHMDREHQTRFLFGGNRSGKSYSVVAEVVMAITGVESIYCEGACEKFRKPPLMVRHWCDDLKRHVPGVLLPIYYKLLPPGMVDESKGDGGFNKADSTLHLSNGSWVQFLSYGMPQRKSVAAALDLVAFDEPPTESIYDSQYGRVSTRGGHLIGAMTLDEQRATHSIQWIGRRVVRRENADGTRADHVAWWQMHTWGNFEALIAEARTEAEANAIKQGYDNWVAGLSEQEYAVVIEGKGGYLTGLVYPEFREHTHARYDLLGAADFAELARKGYGTIRCGLDYGMNHPTAFVWMYRHGQPALPRYDLAEGDCIVYREYKQRGMRVNQCIERIKRLSTGKDGRLEPVERVYADESIWRADGKEGLNVGQLFVRGLKPWPVRRQTYRPKKIGHERVRAMLADREGAAPWPALRFLKGRCRKLTSEMYEYHYKPESQRTGKSPDETNDYNDDLVDALRYAIISLPIPRARQTARRPSIVHPITGVPIGNFVPLHRLGV